MRRLFGSINSLAIRRYYSNTTTQEVRSLFNLFPKSFPNNGPPRDSFLIDSRQLRREFRTLQSEHHPDIVMGSAALASEGKTQQNGIQNGVSDKYSALLNKAYSTLSNPYSRLAHFIELHHPDHLDISRDDTSKQLISHFQGSSTSNANHYQEVLLVVLEAHETLEFASNEQDLEELEQENDERISQGEHIVEKLLKEQHPPNWDLLMMEAIKLKYWMNIKTGIRDWEPGKPVQLTH